MNTSDIIALNHAEIFTCRLELQNLLSCASYCTLNITSSELFLSLVFGDSKCLDRYVYLYSYICMYTICIYSETLLRTF
jgi:hypothetical protein